MTAFDVIRMSKVGPAFADFRAALLWLGSYHYDDINMVGHNESPAITESVKAA